MQDSHRSPDPKGSLAFLRPDVVPPRQCSRPRKADVDRLNAFIEARLLKSKVQLFHDDYGGVGLCASEDLSPGETVLVDHPVVICSTDLRDMLQKLFALRPSQLSILFGIPTHEDNLSSQEESEIISVVQSMTDDIRTLSVFRWFVCLMKANAHGLCHKQTSWGLYPIGARANHSCAPNLSYRNVGGELRYIALRNIKKGEELHMTYVNSLFASRLFRQGNLYRQKMFVCRCQRCVQDSTTTDFCRLIECPFCRPTMTQSFYDEIALYRPPKDEGAPDSSLNARTSSHDLSESFSSTDRGTNCSELLAPSACFPLVNHSLGTISEMSSEDTEDTSEHCSLSDKVCDFGPETPCASQPSSPGVDTECEAATSSHHLTQPAAASSSPLAFPTESNSPRQESFPSCTSDPTTAAPAAELHQELEATAQAKAEPNLQASKTATSKQHITLVPGSDNPSATCRSGSKDDSDTPTQCSTSLEGLPSQPLKEPSLFSGLSTFGQKDEATVEKLQWILRNFPILTQTDATRWVCTQCRHVLDESEPPIASELLLQSMYTQLEILFLQPDAQIWYRKVEYLKSIVDFTLGRFHWLNAGCDFLLSRFFVSVWHNNQSPYFRHKAFECAFRFFDFVDTFSPEAMSIDVVPWSSALMRIALSTGDLLSFIRLANRYLEPLQALYGTDDPQVQLFKESYDYLTCFGLTKLVTPSGASPSFDFDENSRLVIQRPQQKLVSLFDIKVYLQKLVASSAVIDPDDVTDISSLASCDLPSLWDDEEEGDDNDATNFLPPKNGLTTSTDNPPSLPSDIDSPASLPSLPHHEFSAESRTVPSPFSSPGLRSDSSTHDDEPQLPAACIDEGERPPAEGTRRIGSPRATRCSAMAHSMIRLCAEKPDLCSTTPRSSRGQHQLLDDRHLLLSSCSSSQSPFLSPDNPRGDSQLLQSLLSPKHYVQTRCALSSARRHDDQLNRRLHMPLLPAMDHVLLPSKQREAREAATQTTPRSHQRRSFVSPQLQPHVTAPSTRTILPPKLHFRKVTSRQAAKKQKKSRELSKSEGMSDTLCRAISDIATPLAVMEHPTARTPAVTPHKKMPPPRQITERKRITKTKKRRTSSALMLQLDMSTVERAKQSPSNTTTRSASCSQKRASSQRKRRPVPRKDGKETPGGSTSAKPSADSTLSVVEHSKKGVYGTSVGTLCDILESKTAAVCAPLSSAVTTETEAAIAQQSLTLRTISTQLHQRSLSPSSSSLPPSSSTQATSAFFTVHSSLDDVKARLPAPVVPTRSTVPSRALPLARLTATPPKTPAVPPNESFSPLFPSFPVDSNTMTQNAHKKLASSAFATLPVATITPVSSVTPPFIESSSMSLQPLYSKQLVPQLSSSRYQGTPLFGKQRQQQLNQPQQPRLNQPHQQQNFTQRQPTSLSAPDSFLLENERLAARFGSRQHLIPATRLPGSISCAESSLDKKSIAVAVAVPATVLAKMPQSRLAIPTLTAVPQQSLPPTWAAGLSQAAAPTPLLAAPLLHQKSRAAATSSVAGPSIGLPKSRLILRPISSSAPRAAT